MSLRSGQLGMAAAKAAVRKAFFPPLTIVFESRPPAPEAQVSRDVLLFLAHPLVSQCTLSPFPAPSGEGVTWLSIRWLWSRCVSDISGQKPGGMGCSGASFIPTEHAMGNGAQQGDPGADNQD